MKTFTRSPLLARFVLSSLAVLIPLSLASADTVFRKSASSNAASGASDLYWDANGIAPGAGGPSPAGTWGTDAFWNNLFDGTGATGAWTDGANAVFAAGTDGTGAYTVTVNGSQTAAGLFFQEGAVTLNGGTLSLAGAGVVDVSPGLTATIGSAVAGSVGLTKNNGGALMLTNANPYSGNTVINGGSLMFNLDSQLGAPPALTTPDAIQINDATLHFTSGVVTFHSNRGIRLGGRGGAFHITPSQSGAILLFDGVNKAAISGRTLTKTGPGDLRIYRATNTFAQLVINEGAVTIGQASFPGFDECYGAVPAVFTPDAIVIQNDATNRTVGSATVTISANRGLTLGPGGGVLRSDVQALVVNSAITGPGGLRKEGNRNLTLNGNNTYQGPTVINGVQAGSTSRAAITFNGYSTGPGHLIVNDGTLTLNHWNRYAATFLNGGRINANTNGCLGTGLITIQPATNQSNSVLLVNATSLSPTNVILANDVLLNPGPTVIDIAANSGRELVLNGKVSGTPNWIKNNSGSTGAVVLGNESNDFSGSLTCFSGSILAAANHALGAPEGITVISNGASLAFRGGVQYLTPEPVLLHGFGRLGLGALSNDSGNCSFAGPVTLAAHSGVGGAPGTTLTLDGVIGETGGTRVLSKLTAGAVALTAPNAYSGGTLISNGVLIVANVTGSGTGPGPVTVYPGGTLAGPGSVTGPVNLGGAISPGASTGTLRTGPQTWEGGASYVWQINDADASAGANPGWDLLAIDGALAINASSTNKFTIDLTSLTLTDTPGNVHDFDGIQSDYTWTLVTTTGGITGFDPAAFHLRTVNFSNPLGRGLFLLETARGGLDLALRFVRAPIIAVQPIGGAAECGEPFALSVTAAGTPPLHYQWSFNGQEIPGANGPTFSLSSAVLGQAGVYQVMVSNRYGIEISAGAPAFVLDTRGPVVTLNGASPITVDCHGSLSDPGATAQDVCAGNRPVTVSGTVDVNTPGTYTLTYRATDPSGNIGTAVRTVRVVDATAPSITCPADITAHCVSGSDVTFTVNAQDACDHNPLVTCTPPSGSVFPLGRTPVNCLARDGSGNTSPCAFAVIITDTTAPTLLTCASNQTLSAGANCRATLPDLAPLVNATDNCSVTVTQSPPAGVSLGLGNSVVTLTAFDPAGNSVSCTATVTVRDTTAPTANCPPDQYAFTTNATGADVTFAGTATDNCDGNVQLVCVPASGTFFLVGENLVQCRATDAQGNASACSFRVLVTLIIEGNRPPVAMDNAAGVTEGRAARIPLAKLLANDSDPDGDSLQVITVSPTSARGASVRLTSSNVTYQALLGVTGTDVFSYTVTDGQGGTATAAVVMLLRGVNEPSQNLVGGLVLTPHGVLVRFAGIPGRTYVIQRTPDLQTPWTTLGYSTVPTDGIGEFEDTAPPPGQAFYRAIAP